MHEKKNGLHFFQTFMNDKNKFHSLSLLWLNAGVIDI